ncbi:MAG: cadmium-translocating P-type ATPase [Clostridia bacterium]|nr:cadmium-translocating P-type ATPase [Clostridia bacterium]
MHNHAEGVAAAAAADAHAAPHPGHMHEHGGHSHDHGNAHAGHSHGEGEEEGPLEKSWSRVIAGGIIMIAGLILENTVGLSLWVSFAIYFAAYLILGIDVLAAAAVNIAHGKVFDENFLMTVATLGTFALGIWQQSGDFAEACAVMLLYQVGELLTDAAVDKSRDSIASLMDLRPDYANLEIDGRVEKVNPQDVKIGQTIVIRPGEKVPLDSVVTEGTSSLNTAALTGESMPRDVTVGSQLLAGCVNESGLLHAEVEKGYAESTAAKILDVMENASSHKAEPERFITKFARYYTPIVCLAALIVALVPPLFFGGAWETWTYRALLFLIISCPCALVVSVPLTYFSGLGAASKNGILIKGANYFEALRNISEVVFDKTGTLTKGTFSVQSVNSEPGVSKQDVLEAAAAAEQNSSHPIARSVLAAAGSKPAPADDVKEIAGRGVSAVVDGTQVLAGNALLMKDEKISFKAEEAPGTVLYVAKGGKFLGSILIADEPKADAKQVLSELHSMNIRTAMLTGDNCSIGERVGKELGVGETYCELLPQQKVEMLEKIEKANTDTAFVGDGINDAPVLSAADIGIAMGGVGSDAAIEAADVVLMHDQLSEIPVAVGIARKTRRIVVQNVVFALAVKLIVMILGVLGIANMWLAVFADVGVTLIAVVNSLRALFYARH